MAQIDKRNIVSLAFHHVAKELARAADPVSWILFVLFLAAVVVSGSMHALASDVDESLYQRFFLAFWYGAWGLFVLATVGPIFNVARERKEVPLGILIGVGVLHLITFIGISVVVLLHYRRPEAVTGLMAAFAAAIMVGIGWVVQHQSSARASRRTHTFNILMQSRLSKEFQEQVKRRCDYYYSGVVIPVEDAPLSTMDGLRMRIEQLTLSRDRELAQAREESKEAINGRYADEILLAQKKHESLQGVKYLLNFYEFMSAGICQRELDENLLKASVGGIVRGLYDDTRHLRAYLKDVQPRVFCEMDKVMEAYW